MTKAADTIDTVVVRVLHSLSGTDAWHARKGFVLNRKCAEVLFYDRSRGFVGLEVCDAR